jgi:hypothetical protein
MVFYVLSVMELGWDILEPLAYRQSFETFSFLAGVG